MGEIAVHEFITLDGVVENPGWTMQFPFDPRMAEAIGGMMQASSATSPTAPRRSSPSPQPIRIPECHAPRAG